MKKSTWTVTKKQWVGEDIDYLDSESGKPNLWQLGAQHVPAAVLSPKSQLTWVQMAVYFSFLKKRNVLLTATAYNSVIYIYNDNN